MHALASDGPSMLTFGVPQLRAPGAPAFAPERRFQLLAVLAVRAGEWVLRDELAALLWPDRLNADARRNLRHVVFKARTMPGVAGFEATEHALRWIVATDLQAFEQALRDGQRLQAIAWRRGRVLDGIDDPGNAALAEWLAAQRAHVEGRWQQAAHDALADQALAPPQRVEVAQRLLDADPLDEAAMAALLDAELALGHTATAQRLYRDYAHRLADELGVEPSHRLRDRFGRDAAAAPVPVAAAPEGADDSSFVGRRVELAEVAALLARPGCRLITIVGPGGIGKSRLAAQAAKRFAAANGGAGIWVELQDLTDIAALTARLAQRLDVPIAGARDPLQRIGSRLGERRVCCVLDNAEHLDALPGWIEQLLAAAPSLVLLVTSRTRLRIAAEWPLPLAGLAVPDDDSRDLEAASAFDAVRLFEARAAAAQRGFSLARHLDAVIGIVEATDGMPLAIELAAAWVRLLPPEEIARELRQSIDLLERDPRAPGEPARPEHRSLRAVLDRTWQLLAPSERDAMAALSVCRGGFARAAALAVGAAPLPVLSSLVDRSLLTADDSGRFGMHPLVAAYAAERLLVDPARAEACARRHAEHYARLAADLVARAGADHEGLCAGIEGEYANGRAAWQHAVALGRSDWVAQAIAAWRTYFEVRGRVGEGIVHFQQALDLAAERSAQAALAAEVRAALSRLHYLRGEHQTGLAIAEAGAALAEQGSDRRALARCLANAGSCHSAQAQWGAARSCFERALAIGRADGVADEISTALNNLGIVAKNEGRYDDALAHYAQALGVERERGRQAAVVRCLSSLGGLHLSRGDWASARQCMEEGLRLAERHRFDFFVPVHACGLGEALLELGELGDAERHLARALERSRSADNPIIAVMAEANLARVATRRGAFGMALQRLRSAARHAHERGLANLSLQLALLFGEWLRALGRPAEARHVWSMVAAHPQADAGMRDSAARWRDALAPAQRDEAGREPATLAAVTERLLGEPALDDAAARADQR